MTLTEQSGHARENAGRSSGGPGWTGIHSWTFLAIIAIGLAVIVIQNRYHYLNPQGLGKAYRIDKIFGGIQEFDPSAGWIKAQLMAPPTMGPLSGVNEPPSGAPNRAVPMNMPGTLPKVTMSPTPGTPGKPIEEQDADEPVEGAAKPGAQSALPSPIQTPSAKETPTVKEQPAAEPSRDEKFRSFMSAFPEYGEDEFQLATDDLYPDWRKRSGDKGTWKDFLKVYGDFIQWYIANDSPQESGTKLWRKFLAEKGL